MNSPPSPNWQPPQFDQFWGQAAPAQPSHYRPSKPTTPPLAPYPVHHERQFNPLAPVMAYQPAPPAEWPSTTGTSHLGQASYVPSTVVAAGPSVAEMPMRLRDGVTGLATGLLMLAAVLAAAAALTVQSSDPAVPMAPASHHVEKSSASASAP